MVALLGVFHSFDVSVKKQFAGSQPQPQLRYQAALSVEPVSRQLNLVIVDVGAE